MSAFVYGRDIPVRATCPDCGEEWDDAIHTESDTGAKYLTNHEECPKCGGEPQTDDLDELDIQERRLEARGEDF